MMASLVHGVPQVVLPFMADNFDHADGVAASCAGVARPAAEVDGAWVGAAVARVLDDPQYRAASDTIAADIAGQPSPAETAERLVRLIEGAYA
jgi:UDP:flavonoid glycosyltransferase YjiC (YdhE family)